MCVHSSARTHRSTQGRVTGGEVPGNRECEGTAWREPKSRRGGGRLEGPALCRESREPMGTVGYEDCRRIFHQRWHCQQQQWHGWPFCGALPALGMVWASTHLYFLSESSQKASSGETIITPILQRGNSHREVQYPPKVTQLISSRSRSQTQAIWILSHALHHPPI